MNKDMDDYREDRITMRAVVDAYGSEERAMGWYYYLEGEIVSLSKPCVCEEKQRRHYAKTIFT